MAMVQGDRPKRAYVSKGEARSRLIDSALELLQSKPFAQVTTREIAEGAGLNPLAIQTAFDGQMDLYAAVADTLLDRVAMTLSELDINDRGDLASIFHPDLILRSRLVAWLIGQGSDPSTFAISPERSSFAVLTERQRALGASEDVARVFASMIGYLMAGFSIFSETRMDPPEDLALAIEMMAWFRSRLPEFSDEIAAKSDHVD